MNRSLSLHPASLLIGLAFGVLVLLSMSQAPPLNARALTVQYGPDPRDMVQLHEDTPYVVPTGKLFVLTGLGVKFGGVYSVLQVNGQSEVTAGSQSSSSVCAVPPGFTVPAGSTITI